jgi:hypothetical protein
MSDSVPSLTSENLKQLSRKELVRMIQVRGIKLSHLLRQPSRMIQGADVGIRERANKSSSSRVICLTPQDTKAFKDCSKKSTTERPWRRQVCTTLNKLAVC